MIAIEQFGMDPEQNGMMLSYIGVISLFMQGIGISTLTKRAEDKVLMALSTVTLTVAYFVMVRKIDFTHRAIVRVLTGRMQGF